MTTKSNFISRKDIVYLKFKLIMANEECVMPNSITALFRKKNSITTLAIPKIWPFSNLPQPSIIEH